MKKLYFGLTVIFLVACGGGGGMQALADVTDEMFNALVARVTQNENAIAALPATLNETLVDVNSSVVGAIVGHGTGNSVQVDILLNGIGYTATFTPAGSWQPLNTYHTEPTCSQSSSHFIDRAELTVGFWFAWSDGTDWFSLLPVNGQVMPGWKREGFSGSCMAIANPRAQFYTATLITGGSQFTGPFSIQ